MIQTVFRTQDVAEPDRFDFWHERVVKTHAPLYSRSDHADAYEAEMRLVDLGAAQVWPTFMQSVHMTRTPKLIRQSDPEYYHVTLILSDGVKRISQGGHASVIGPREMHVVDSSRPFAIQVECDSREPIKAVGLEVPKTLLPLPPDRVDRLLAQRLPGHEGIGALLTQFLVHVDKEASRLRPSDGARMETVLIDLLSATLAHHLDADDRLPAECRTRTLVLSIRSFVRQHLKDPDLTPSAIAAAHHISLSHLHRLFQSDVTTVAAWIRQQRLEHARRDLAEPAWRHVPVHAIATRWGFTHHAGFTRAFRTAYGLTPTDYRQRAADGHPVQ